MSVWFWLPLAAVIVVLLLSLALLLVIQRMRLVPTRGWAIDAGEVPEKIGALFAPARRQLEAMGFVEGGAVALESAVVQGKPQVQHGIVYLHCEVAAAALLVNTLVPDQGRHHLIQFVARRDDGTTLVTRNRQSIVGPSPDPAVQVQDCWLPTWRDVWQAHVAAMNATPGAQPGASWRRLDASTWIAETIAAEQRAFDLRRTRGDYVDAGDGLWRVGIPHAVRMVARAWSTFRASRRPMRDDVAVSGGPTAHEAMNALTAEDMPATAQAKVDAYERETARGARGAWSTRTKWLVFAVTGALAAASFGLSVDLPTLAALMLVLVVHEAGHFLAMRRVGYRDLQVFFMPFLGAAVTGRHGRPTARQELFVLFAGPLPGLMAGLAALAWSGSEGGGALQPWAFHLAVLAVLVNGFNLLPIHPLDGGKIVEILVLARWPWLAFAARVLGIALLVWWLLAMDRGAGSAVLLALVLLMLSGVGHLWRETSLASSLRREGLARLPDRRRAAEAVFGRLEQMGYGARPWAEQRLMADTLVPQLVRPPMTFAGRLLGVGVYVVALALPLIVLVAQAWHPVAESAEATASLVADHERELRRTREQRVRDLDALKTQVMAQPDPARRWALIAARIDDVTALLDEAHGAADAAAASASAPRAPSSTSVAVDLLDEAARLAPRLPDAAARTATVALWRLGVTRDPAARVEWLDRAFHAYDGASDGGDVTPLVMATVGWLDEAPFVGFESRMARIDRCLDRAGSRHELRGLQTVHAYKVDHRLALGQDVQALAHARDLVEAALASGDVWRAMASSRLLVDATLTARDATTALAVLDELLPRLEALPPPGHAKAAASPRGAASEASVGARSTGMTFVATALRRHGMWIAQSAGRTDWQRANVEALAAARGNVMGELSWWTRATLWVMTRGQSARLRETVLDLEEAHWRGDSEAARRIAAALDPGRVGALPGQVPHGRGERFIGPRMAKMLDKERQAVYRAYGLAIDRDAEREQPVRPRSGGS